MQETPNRRCGMLPEVRIRLFLQCDPAGRRPAKIQFRKIRSSAAAEERKPAAAHAEGGIAPPAASGTSSAGRGLTNGGRGIYSRQSVYDSRTALQGVLPKTTESVIPDKGNDARKSSTGTPRYPRRATPFRSVLPATTFRFGRIAVRSIAF